MAGRILAFDWSQSPLGSMDRWPQSLQVAVDIVLAHPLPMIVLWGQALTQIYNDGYAKIAGNKHPIALGQPTRECWPEVWHINAPVYERVLARGESILLEDRLFPITRNGVAEDAYFTLTYSPIRDDDGNVGGVILTVMETTAKVVAEAERERWRAEAARREALTHVEQRAQLLDTALTHINDFAYIFDRDGRFLYVNQPLLDLWGLTLEQVVGKDFVDLKYPAELAAKHQREIRHVVETKTRVVDESQYTSPTGVTGNYEYIFNPVLTEDGTVAVVTGSTRNITARRRLDAELKTQRARLADIIERAPAFICTLRGPEHVFELANERYYEIVGKRDLMGKPIRAALPELEGQGFFELLDRVYRTAETFTGDEMPVLLRRRNDDSLDQRFMNLVYQALREADGTVSGIFVHGVDVTELVRSREALRVSEERHRRLVETAHEGIWTIEADGRTTYVNRRMAELLGYAPEEMIGRVHTDFMWEQDRPKGDVDMESRRKGTAEVWDQRYRRKDGSELWTVASCTTLYDSDGKFTGALGMFTDITGRKRAEAERQALLESERAARDEAERASLMKDQFLATLSHELRTPLTAMLLWSMLLRTGAVPDAAGQAQALEAIEVSAQAQKQLIEDLLDISRMTSGKLTLSLQEVELEEVIRAAVDAVRPMAQAKGIEVEVVFGRRVGLARVDPDRIRQVVWNLLNNAVKFTDAGGEVQVRLLRHAKGAQIQVQDTGRGITPEFLPHVFERFRQQDGSSTRAIGGLGLGLSIARQIAELHGGTIGAESDGPGKGATFTVDLPLPATFASSHTATPGEVAAAATAGSGQSPALRGVRALIVEDEPITSTAMVWLLRNEHADVTAVGSAAAAVAAFREGLNGRRYDVVLSDIGLPERDGYDLLRELREIEAQAGGEHSVTPVIAVTAYARPEDREHAFAAGFHAHVAKPVEPTALVAEVAAAIGLVSDDVSRPTQRPIAT